MKNISFVKAHGSGNDFIIFIKENCPKNLITPKFIYSICKRRTGVGADGVLVLSKISKTFFHMDYYNCDGSWETFCANGSRCATLLLYNKGIIGKNSTFESGDGPHQAKIDDSNKIWIKMKKPVYKSDWLNIHGFSGRYVNSGAKHFACKTDKLNFKIAEKFGPKIRYDQKNFPKGVNVNFYKIQSLNQIHVITYEKGIEKVMLSCGSGAVAACYHADQANKLNSPLKITTPGGELNLKFNSNWNDIWLGGPTNLLFESSLNIDDY